MYVCNFCGDCHWLLTESNTAINVFEVSSFQASFLKENCGMYQISHVWSSGCGTNPFLPWKVSQPSSVLQCALKMSSTAWLSIFIYKAVVRLSKTEMLTIQVKKWNYLAIVALTPLGDIFHHLSLWLFMRDPFLFIAVSHSPVNSLASFYPQMSRTL